MNLVIKAAIVPQSFSGSFYTRTDIIGQVVVHFHTGQQSVEFGTGSEGGSVELTFKDKYSARALVKAINDELAGRPVVDEDGVPIEKPRKRKRKRKKR